MNNLLKTSRFDSNGNISQIWETFDKLNNNFQAAITIAMRSIDENRLIDSRANRINELLNDTKLNYNIEEVAMGSGGVGQLQVLKKEVRFQIGYGHGKHNYAMTLVIPFKQDN